MRGRSIKTALSGWKKVVHIAIHEPLSCDKKTPAYTAWVKKTPMQNLSMFSQITDRFFKKMFTATFSIFNKAIIKDPATPKTRPYTTLWNISYQKLNLTNSAWTTVIKTSTQFLPVRSKLCKRWYSQRRNVRLSVRLSHSGIASKRSKLASWFLHHWRARTF